MTDDEDRDLARMVAECDVIAYNKPRGFVLFISLAGQRKPAFTLVGSPFEEAGELAQALSTLFVGDGDEVRQTVADATDRPIVPIDRTDFEEAGIATRIFEMALPATMSREKQEELRPKKYFLPDGSVYTLAEHHLVVPALYKWRESLLEHMQGLQ